MSGKLADVWRYRKLTGLIGDQLFSCVITGRLNKQFANHNAQSNLQYDSQISPAAVGSLARDGISKSAQSIAVKHDALTRFGGLHRDVSR